MELSETYLQQDLLGSASTYSGKEAVEVFKELVESREGYISCEELREKYGDKTIREMVARNVLYYRPKSRFARDLEPAPTEAVITPTGQPALRAMEALLERKRKRLNRRQKLRATFVIFSASSF